ncbi:MAG TPA: hypothetical protein PK280_18390, partial [Planctomycetota bacterium]|nr:hypothetical protein [Planctomycetota bacterium]
RHQEKDGHWDRKKWADGPNISGGDVAVTGLATLAFLGAGYTSKDGGKYADVVRRAENWMCSTLDEATKHHPWSPVKLGDFDTNMYEQGMAALALAEAYGMTRDERLRKYAQAAVDAVVEAQGPYEGWTYQSKHGKAGRNDTSITGWQVMALKSAKIAGLKVDGSAFQGASHWLEVATDPANGVVAYESAPTIDKVKRGSGTMALCAAGMIMQQFLGTPSDSPQVKAAADQLKKYLPTWDTAAVDTTFAPYPGGKNGTNYYYWYYGSLGMFQYGGDHWAKWNEAMKKILTEHQRKGGPLDGTAADVDGSYDPVGSGGVPHGGRVMSTALAALTLEVYYRYLPLYSTK